MSKEEEYELLSNLSLRAKIIITNSPRKKIFTNSSFPENDYVPFINNAAKDIVKKYKFEGFGDYCGYKDVLPQLGGGQKGSALILFYDFIQNQFFSFCNHNTSLGQSGYSKLVPELINKKDVFNPLGNCLAYSKIENLSSNGTWAYWNNICIRRYISEIYFNQKDL
ncbi:MAG: hypothetical protein EOL97_08015 [Spirochaetia bacterium]|nr:hypothetical protein [Spirochaetia bacterium]